MLDPRITKLAETLINYSTAMQPGEKVMIEAFDIPEVMTCELIRLARNAGADPLVLLKNSRIDRALRIYGSPSQMGLMAEVEALAMKNVDAYIGIRGNLNLAEMSDVPDDKQELYLSNTWQKVHQDIRIPHTRWVVLRWPHAAAAQQAGLSTEAFEDLFFKVCNIDYAKMSAAMQPLVNRMNETDRVRITGRGTDLRFSLKGMGTEGCGGKHNIPDGEAATGPVRDSVHGKIQFNARTVNDGVIHDNVYLEIKNGKIVKAVSSNTTHLNRVLDRDEGARYIGEFAIGFNPYMTRPILDILFDEKITGSFHFTPGHSVAPDTSADNGNRSVVHWDMVCLQDKGAGGGEIWFDDELIRKDGLFVTEDLLSLNPENLK